MGDLSSARVLLVEANSTFASIAREQLYAAGVSAVAWSRDIISARQAVEVGDYSALVVSLDMESGAGRNLVEELKQAGALPPWSVVVYVTDRPTYARVLEAAETSADGCIVRPYKAEVLLAKLDKAFRRNERLRPLFRAIRDRDCNQTIRKAALAIQEWPELGNYCARLAVEMLLQHERPQDALSLLKQLPASQVPWVQMATARAELLSGRRGAAHRILASCIERDPMCGEAHDLLAKLEVEQGHLTAARTSIDAACAATPGCMIRTQHAGALAFLCGDAAAARPLLSRARFMGGPDSRLLDGFSLFLLGVIESDAGLLSAMRSVRDQLGALAQRHRVSTRLQRMNAALRVLYLYRSTGNAEHALAAIHRLAQDTPSDFRGEDCAVVAIVWTRLRLPSGRVVGDLSGWLSSVGTRLVTGRGMLRYLSAAVASVPEAVSALQGCHALVVRIGQECVDACADPGQPQRVQAGLRALFDHARSMRNARLLDLFVNLATQHGGQLGPEASALVEQARSLSAKYGPGLRSISGIAQVKRLPGVGPVNPIGSTLHSRPGQIGRSSRPGALQSGFVDLWFEA